jgi:hypothetical protein
LPELATNHDLSDLCFLSTLGLQACASSARLRNYFFILLQLQQLLHMNPMIHSSLFVSMAWICFISLLMLWTLHSLDHEAPFNR